MRLFPAKTVMTEAVNSRPKLAGQDVLCEGFDEGLTRLEKLLHFVLAAVSNQDGVSFYSDTRLEEMLDIRFPRELDGARKGLVARDLLAYESGIYQVLDL